MELNDIGEFGLIKRLTKNITLDKESVIVGVGDDVAVVKTKAEKYLLLTCDILIEGTHFTKETITPYQLGKKVVAINVSDIAAKGGIPKQALISIGLPKDTKIVYVEQIYRGLKEQSKKFNIDIVGGNTALSKDKIFIDLFLVGEIKPDLLLLRSGAKPDDKILVTGNLGDSSAGLKIIENQDLKLEDIKFEKKYKTKLKQAHLSPNPRLLEGRIIAKSNLANSMMDISDGLSSDLAKICEASNVGAIIWEEKIPVSKETLAFAKSIGKSPFNFALHGGEDYELLFTTPKENVEIIIKKIQRETKTKVTEIGEIKDRKFGIKIVKTNGEMTPLNTYGWNHFKM
ncbi:Thiamine-monophosphate kinase [subsurface metagenome]